MTGSAFVRTLILGNMADGNCSIEGMCQLLWEDAVDITKQGLDFRFTESAVEFMQAIDLLHNLSFLIPSYINQQLN